MKPLRLWVKSPAILMSVPDGSRPSNGEDGPFRLTDLWVPGKEVFDAVSYGEYRIRIEYLVADKFNLAEGFPLLVDFCSHLEKLWPFATGSAMRGGGFAPYLDTYRVPAGWSSNRERVSVELQRRAGSKYIVKHLGGPVSHTIAGAFPVARLLPALDGYARIDRTTALLIELYYHAITSPMPILLFCKALEIVRALLPGRTDAQKQNALPADVRHHLRGNFHELFSLANNRLETRHAVGNKRGPALHPMLSRQERDQLLLDGDAIIRGIVCAKLGIPYVRLVDR